MLPTLGLLAGLLLGAKQPSPLQLLPQADAPIARGASLLPESRVPGGWPLALLQDSGVPATVSAEPSREGLRRAHRALRYTTAGSLLVTGGLGTLVAINQGTSFTQGRCDASSHRPIFGDYGCEPLSIVHGISGVLSVTLYTATTALGLALGEPPLGHGGEYGRLYRILSYVALVGMAIQPVLGLVSAYPDIIGVSAGSQEKFGEVTRTVHVGIGYVTIATYLTTVILEF